MFSKYRALVGSKRVALPGARLLGRANPHAIIEVTVKLRRKRELPELKGRLSTTMKRGDLVEMYGAAETDAEMASRIFEALGLRIVSVNLGSRTVRVSGTVAAMENAFLVKLFDYAHESGNYRGRVGYIHTPKELRDIVEGVFGLDSRRVARRRKHPVRNIRNVRSLSLEGSWYTPAKLAAHYNFPAGDGAGQSVGLIEFGGGYFPDDLNAFCQTVGVSVPKVTAISTDGIPTNQEDGAEGEVMLDIEVVTGFCPNANIVVYFAQWTEQGWITALDAVVHDTDNNPGVVSISWGYAEDADLWTEQAMTQLNETLKEAAYLNTTICVAAGDDGSSDAVTDGQAHVDFPGSSPYVLSVGGTTMLTGDRTKTDIVWKEGDGLRADGGGSTGGGVSAVFPRPDWQKQVKIASVNPGAIVGRVVPDVAANADWTASPYLLIVDGASQPNGGTSAASPLWAALITLINGTRAATNRVGYLTPVLYQAHGGNGGTTVGAASCDDIVSGDNITDAAGGYSAGHGYDAVSGWGTPNGANLLEALSYV